jgi:hypothetical protein
MAYTNEEAARDAKALYKTVAGKRFFNKLMDEAGIGKVISNGQSRDREQKDLGAHNFVVEKLCDRITRTRRPK